MSVESTICRTLDIRFIDARMLVNEAKVNLNCFGYLDKHQQIVVREEAIRLFESRNHREQLNMQRANWDLEAVKIPTGSLSLSEWQDSALSGSRSESEHSDLSKSQNSPRIRSKLFGQRR